MEPASHTPSDRYLVGIDRDMEKSGLATSSRARDNYTFTVGGLGRVPRVVAHRSGRGSRSGFGIGNTNRLNRPTTAVPESVRWERYPGENAVPDPVHDSY